jgi:hypothetical protein
MEEANRVLGHYSDKDGVAWDTITGSAFKPQPFMATGSDAGWAEGHEDMRKTLDAVNSHVYGQPRIAEFNAGDRSYLQTDTEYHPTHNVLGPQAKAEVWPSRMSKEDAAATYRSIAQTPDDYTIARFRRQNPSGAYHLGNADKHLANAHGYIQPAHTHEWGWGGVQPSEDAMRAYIAAANAKKAEQSQKSPATSYIISEYMKRLNAAGRRKAMGQTPQTSFESSSTIHGGYAGPVHADEQRGYSTISAPAQQPEEQGYSKITFERRDRVPAAGGDDEQGGDDDVRQARIRRAAEEAAAAEAEELEEQMRKAMTPLQQRIKSVEASIAATAASPPAASATTSAGARGLTFSVPGPIKMDHLELPGGEYSLTLGANTAIYPPGPSTPSVSPTAAPAAAAAAAPVAAEEEEDGYPEGVLDKRKDLHVDLDRDAIKAAAAELQKSYIDEAGDEKSATGSSAAVVAATAQDDVLDSSADTHRGIDRTAMRAAAVAIKQQISSQHARASTSHADDASADDVLDTSKVCNK